MSQQLAKLQWFKDNVELQLEDIEIEQKGNAVEIYLDTADVQTGLLGLLNFYDEEGKFLEYKFSEGRSLIGSLISAGWLHSFKMLPPHLSEFFQKVEGGFDLPPTQNWQERAENFLRDAGLLNDEEARATLRELSEKNTDELKALFNRQAGRGVRWFIAVHSLPAWHQQLGIWTRRDFLDLTSDHLDLADILDSDDFTALKRTFDEVRTQAQINNFVDAAALTCLIKIVARFNAGESNTVPRFFIPRAAGGTWYRVLEKLNWSEKLTCRLAGAKVRSSNVFRDEDYFTYRITFRRSNHGNRERNEENLERERNELSKLHDVVSEGFRESAEITGNSKAHQFKQTIKDIEAGKDLNDLIDSLTKYSVLEKDWFESSAADDLKIILQNLDSVKEVVEVQSRLYASRKFKSYVSKKREGNWQDLTEELEDFKTASRLWSPLYDSSSKLQSRVRYYSDLERDDYFRVFGLLRYGFPAETHDLINSVLQDLLSSSDDLVRAGCTKTIKHYIAGRRRFKRVSESLYAAVGVLLAARVSKPLNNLLRNGLKTESHFSLKVAYLEQMLRHFGSYPEKPKRFMKLLSELEAEFGQLKTHNKDQAAALAVGLGYLFYELWRSMGGVAVWMPAATGMQVAQDENKDSLNEIIDKAVVYARFAQLNLPADQLDKKIYALNQLLFYSTEGETDREFLNNRDLIFELISFQADTNVWQFRFDDTLARFYLRTALLTENEKEKKELIETARRTSNEAYMRSDDDALTKEFYNFITAIWAKSLKTKV